MIRRLCEHQDVEKGSPPPPPPPPLPLRIMKPVKRGASFGEAALGGGCVCVKGRESTALAIFLLHEITSNDHIIPLREI